MLQPRVPLDHVRDGLSARLHELAAFVASLLPREWGREHVDDVTAAVVAWRPALLFASPDEVRTALDAFRAEQWEFFEPTPSRAQVIRTRLANPQHCDPSECRRALVKANRSRRLRGLGALPLGERDDHLAIAGETLIDTDDIDREAGFGLPAQLLRRHIRNGVSSSRDGMLMLHRERENEELTAVALVLPFAEDREPRSPEDAAPKPAPAAKLLPASAKGD